MKKLFFILVLAIGLMSFTSSNKVEKVSTVDVEKTLELVNSMEFADADFSIEITNSLEVFGGKCCVTIKDGDGDVVLQDCFPANTPEACESMLNTLLDYFNNL